MDTVYGTKKYFQSLSGASDLYRSGGGGCRVMANDYNYQNTLGRRSTLGAYYHMNKQPSYTNDHSVSSQFGYNTWGIWRDGRNIAPSTFSTKTQHPHYQKTKSFSIILTTAAFIVLLAVISIAGLAFYFSTIKANMEDPVLGFEGSFRIAKGDLFSTGLKYNHTTTYKQKIEFYKRFVERALTDNGLQPLRTDIWGFGEGPLIKVFFRTFLDVRKLPQNIHNVEEFIKESLFVETTAVKSLYRSLRLDAESVEVKRILDEQVVKSASLFKDSQSVPTSQTHLEKRLMKKGGSAPTLLSKSSVTTIKPRTTPRTHSPDDEPDVDVENAPVIQGSFEGSFEITKTDADIAHKKVAPTKAYSSLAPKVITPYSLRVKPKKPSIEKLTTIIPQHQTKASTTTTTTTTTSTTTTTTTTTPTPAPTTTTATTTTTTTTTPKPTTTPTTKPTTASTTSTTSTTTPRPTTRPTTTTTTTTSFPFTYPPLTQTASTHTVPKLDSNLFTSVPILDTQPWRPIHREVPEFLPGPPPALPTKMLQSAPALVPVMPRIPAAAMLPSQDVAQHRIDEMELPFIAEGPPVPPTPPTRVGPYDKYSPPFFSNAFHKPSTREELNSTPDAMFYHHNFGHPSYMPGSESIERLGAGAHVQPHPLPVPLIDDVVVPAFRPLNPTLDTNDKLPFSIEAGDEKFEHLGGGVIVKKHDNSSSSMSSTPEHFELIATSPLSTITSPPTTRKTYFHTDPGSTVKPKPNPVLEKDSLNVNSEFADTIGEFFMDLLNLPKEEETTTTSKQSVSTEGTVESRIEPDDSGASSQKESKVEEQWEEVEEQTSRDAQEPVTQTSKPNFLNLRDIILKRNQAANHTKKVSTTTAEGETTRSTAAATQIITTQTPTTTTTKRNRIRPAHNKLPTILDDSNLFPSHSKWEFVNSSSSNNNFGHTGNMRRVYNKTLQAWVSEDVEKSENLTLNDIKLRINNATNIQDISLIFDTLASKLGITPSVANKMPPFSPNKLKQTHKHEAPARTPSPSTTTFTSTSTFVSPHTSTTNKATSTISSTTKITTAVPTTIHIPFGSTKHFVELPLQRQPAKPSNPPTAGIVEDTSSEGIGAAIPVVGEAEVEVIDPLKYEEMLKSSQFAEATTTETSHKLVTLLPVRSNSGVRTYRPLIEETQRSSSGAGSSSGTSGGGGAFNLGGTSIVGKSGSRSSITRKSSMGHSRRFPPAEAVVKGGIKVTVK